MSKKVRSLTPEKCTIILRKEKLKLELKRLYEDDNKDFFFKERFWDFPMTKELGI